MQDKKHPMLKAIKKALTGYIVDWASGNIIEVRTSPTAPIIAFFVHVAEQPNCIVFSAGLDCGDIFSIADITIKAGKVAPLGLGEGFYVLDSGEVLWGSDALAAMSMEVSDSEILAQMPSPSKVLN